MNENYTIIVKTYQLVLWYFKKIEKLPKNHRFTLGEKIQSELIELLLLYTDTIYSSNKKELIQKANRSIEKLRILTKLLHDLNILNIDNKRFILSQLDEIGSMSGGWLKKVK